MSSAVTYKCPNCGAGLIFDAEKQLFACEFCLSDFSEDELKEREGAANEDEKENADFSSEVKAYHCTSCGAEVVTDKSTVADFCYYCHNPVVIEDRVSGLIKPSKIIPFKFGKEQAKEEFLRYAKKKWFLPNDYFSPKQTDKMQGVYYPFWVVDSDTSATLNATGKKVRTWRSGNYRYTETSTFAVSRRGSIRFEDITTSAISTEDRDMLEGILPYPADEHIDFSMPYLQGFIAKKRDLESEALSASVRGKMESYAQTLLSDTVHGYTSVSGKQTTLQIKNSKWDYTLMPVWVLNYQRKGKTYTYAMNGSTGKIYGELPTSGKKLAILGAIVGAAVALLTILSGWAVLFG